MYKKASKLKLRFNTHKGVLSVEQLFDLSLRQLAIIIRNLKDKIKEETGDDELSFLEDNRTVVDEETQLQFEIAKDIYLTKVTEERNLKEEASRKLQLQELWAIKAERQKEATRNISDDELDKRIKELSK